MALIVVSGQGSQGQGSPPGLNYFKNFFVTGNFVVAGIDFGSQSHGGGLVTGTIHVVENPNDGVPNIVPPDADIVGAFLYWQSIIGSEGNPTVHPTFRGYDLFDIQKAVVSPSPDPTFSPCWSGGGQGTNIIKTFRADVRRFLPVVVDASGVPQGKMLVNDADLLANNLPLHDVELPDNGTGNQTPQTAGASLVLIYRLATETLKSVVLYDGLQVKLNGATPTTATQTLRGFYDAPNSGAARLSLLVGTGAKNATEQVFFGTSNVPVATNPFFTRDTNSPGSDRAWDSPSWPVTMPATPTYGTTLINGLTRTYGEQVDVSITHTVATPYDCIATSAMVLSTEVPDLDFDGLLDVWETGNVDGPSPSNPALPLIDPTGQPLPDLRAMGASKTQQDIFIELGSMYTDVAYSTPLGNTVVHTHKPSKAVLDDFATVFSGAPQRRNPANTNQTISTPIKVHFDVGNLYQTGPNASPNVIKYTHADGSPCSSATDPECLARGGEEILEEACVGANCTFDGFRGVVGWKNGFRQLRDKPLNATSEAQCVAMGAGCIRRFDENRRHMFRYGLLAHALGVDRPENPGIPRSVSGVADAGRGGGDFMVTLGLWDGNTGTEFMQKAAMLHEFGHTGGLRHGGGMPTDADHHPNCKPNYESVMNYLYLVRGLPGVGGTPFLDYSRQVLKLVGTPTNPNVDLDESLLTETALKQGNANAAYPPRWYAPKTSSIVDTSANTSASTRHCDGTPLHPDMSDPNFNLPDQTPMVRVGGIYPIGAVDWNANGAPDAGSYPQDINFNGDAGESDAGLNPHDDGNFTGWNDWEHLDLRQTAARRTPSVLSLEISYEDLSSQDVIDTSWIDTSWIDTSWIDTSWIDTSWIDTSWIDTSWIDTSWIDTSWGETDEQMARSQGPGPNSLRVASRTSQSITLEWTPPTAGGPVGPPPNGTGGYEVWKAIGRISATNAPDDIAVGLLPANVCTTTPTQGVVCRYVDNNIQNTGIYQYFIVAAFASGQRTRSEVIESVRP